VIFLTAQGNEVIAREAFIGGASDYFTKDVGLAGYERIYNSIHNHVTYSEGIKRNRTLEAELRICCHHNSRRRHHHFTSKQRIFKAHRDGKRRYRR